MKKLQNRGFTLIELLVVIAIIGILSTIVMVALNSAKDKGSAAGVKSQLSSIRNQAELYYNTTGTASYGLGTLLPAADCMTVTAVLFKPGTNTLSPILNGIVADGIPASKTYCAVNGTDTVKSTQWAVSVIDPSDRTGTQAFCVDYRGYSTTTAVTANAPSTAMTIVTGVSVRCN